MDGPGERSVAEATRRDSIPELGGRNSIHIMSKTRNRCNTISPQGGPIRRRWAAPSRERGMKAGRPDHERGGSGDRFGVAGQTGAGTSEATGRRAIARAPTEPFRRVAYRSRRPATIDASVACSSGFLSRKL